jgi:type IV pilus secretin PilQ/predicted competence protein
MKSIIRKAIFILVLSAFSFYASLPANADTNYSLSPGQGNFFDDSIEISMDFKDASLKDILKILSVQSGLNFLSSEAVQERKVTLYLDKVPLKNAMDKIFQTNNLYYEYDRGANIFIVKDMGKPEIELVTKIFALKYASVSVSQLNRELGGNLGGGSADSSITAIIRKLLSNAGSVLEDGRTNSLIVRDVPTRIPVIAEAISALDVPQPQVLIEVEVLDVNKGLLDKVGFNFGTTPFDMVIKGSTLKSTWPFPSLGDIAKKTIDRGLTSGSIDFNNANTTAGGYEIMFNFIRQQSDSKTLARPRILTLNNETAEFKITTNEAIGINQTQNNGGSIETSVVAVREQTGITLRVTPQINPETGDITMFIMPSVKDTSTSSLSTTANPIKDPEERSTKSIIRVKDGETIMMGGLIRKAYSKTVSKLPFFGDLPFVGRLFSGKSVTPNTERELLVFITPRIIKDETFKFAEMRKYRIPVPEREQEVNAMGHRAKEVNGALDKYEKFDP